MRGVRAVAPLCVLAALSLILVSPYGEFPLNDDWVYTRMHEGLVQQGRLAVHPYSSAYAAVQVIWALPFSLLFGESFTLLRITNLIAAFGVLCATVWCARILGLGRKRSLAAAFVVFVNPLFINMAYTYMTEIPFMLLAMLSAAFYLKALRIPDPKYIALGTIFAVLAFLNRQYGLLLTLAFLVTIVVYRHSAQGFATRKNSVALLRPWLISIPFTYYLAHSSQTDLLYFALVQGDWGVYFLPERAGEIIMKATLYCGLFLLPLTLPYALSLFRGEVTWGLLQRIGAATGAAGLIAYCLALSGPLPNLPNVIRDCGLGPLLLTLQDFSQKDWAPFAVGPWVWWPITILSALSVGVLIAMAISMFRRARTLDKPAMRVRGAQWLFLLLAGAFFMLSPINAIQPVYHDRYILPALPFFAMLACAAFPVWRARNPYRVLGAPGTMACMVFYAFSMSGEQDYLAWNAARWQAANLLQKTKSVRREQIDGGYEYQGYHSRKWSVTSNHSSKRRHRVLDPSKRGPTWRICMRHSQEQTPALTVSYFSWLGFTTRELLVVHTPVVSPPESRYRNEISPDHLLTINDD